MEELADGITLYHADCLEALKTLPADSIDSVVCDPPYHLTSVVKRVNGQKTTETGAYGGGFDPSGAGTGAAFARMSRGFMGQAWDGGDIAFRPETWAEVIRVLKPGGHLLAFSGTRTYHRMACAIEDAGFEVRDMVSWVYGSGFPKSHDVSKGIDRAAGVERTEVVGRQKATGNARGKGAAGHYAVKDGWNILAPATPEAAQWAGWGTALKPAVEPVCMARKPLSESTVAANVLRWGTGAINVGACRVGTDGYGAGLHGACEITKINAGRWPANLIHDGSEEVVGAFPDSKSAGEYTNSLSKPEGRKQIFGSEIGSQKRANNYAGESGSAARFFYCAKASKADRAGSKHPTVKPIKLISYLLRMVTPPGGITLDPFAGSGTTGAAARLEGFRCIMIEREAEYVEDIRRRFRTLEPVQTCANF